MKGNKKQKGKESNKKRCYFNLYSFEACLFVMGLHGIRFNEVGNPLLKKWKSMDMGTHGINYKNVLK